MGDSSHATPHGQKRHPEDELNHEQRLAKRFNLLNLEQNGKLYIPVKPELASTEKHSPLRRRRSNAVTDAMPVEDTKDKVYIHNLDEEIADIESDEEKLIFLPDIERHLMKIPTHLLQGDPAPSHSNEVVLYNIPGSITVPEEQDVVRKAIAETRARARAQTRGLEIERARVNPNSTQAHAQDNENAMDIE